LKKEVDIYFKIIQYYRCPWMDTERTGRAAGKIPAITASFFANNFLKRIMS